MSWPVEEKEVPLHFVALSPHPHRHILQSHSRCCRQVARRLLLQSDKVWPILDTYVHVRAFEVASDSFATLTYVYTHTLMWAGGAGCAMCRLASVDDT